jgi:hypothetical protein
MAYGVNAPFGLQPRQYLDGTPWSGQTSEYQIASGYNTSLFTGDPVYYAANGTIVRATAGDANPILGVFFGCKYFDANNNPVNSPYWPANTVTFQAANATALIVDDPWVLYDVQTNNAAGIGAADIFQNANIQYTVAGSTISGQSGAGLNATLGTTATFQVKIIRFTPNPNNVAGVGYNNVLVLINNNPYKGGTGTVGI